ncbi:MAG TPA: hypothetical protein VF752_10100, partial [Thermoleophilaceae bacterium]
MFTVKVSAVSSAAPERVLGAARDFSERRPKVWRNVKAGHVEVHESGPDFADVTERLSIARSFWERGRYEWSQPDSVKQTVTDSNVLEPGSTWELRAAARDGGGSDVEMVLQRNFRSGLRGSVGNLMNHLGGKRGW